SVLSTQCRRAHSPRRPSQSFDLFCHVLHRTESNRTPESHIFFLPSPEGKFFSCAISFFDSFFPAEDVIRAATVTGVQTCALPISRSSPRREPRISPHHSPRSVFDRDIGSLSA